MQLQSRAARAARPPLRSQALHAAARPLLRSGGVARFRPGGDSEEGADASAVGAPAEQQQQQQQALVPLVLELGKHCAFGRRFSIVGDAPELGAWDPAHGVPMQWSEGDVWRASVALPPGGPRVVFKYVELDEAGRLVAWGQDVAGGGNLSLAVTRSDAEEGPRYVVDLQPPMCCEHDVSTDAAQPDLAAQPWLTARLDAAAILPCGTGQLAAAHSPHEAADAPSASELAAAGAAAEAAAAARSAGAPDTAAAADAGASPAPAARHTGAGVGEGAALPPSEPGGPSAEPDVMAQAARAVAELPPLPEAVAGAVPASAVSVVVSSAVSDTEEQPWLSAPAPEEEQQEQEAGQEQEAQEASQQQQQEQRPELTSEAVQDRGIKVIHTSEPAAAAPAAAAPAGPAAPAAAPAPPSGAAGGGLAAGYSDSTSLRAAVEGGLLEAGDDETSAGMLTPAPTPTASRASRSGGSSSSSSIDSPTARTARSRVLTSLDLEAGSSSSSSSESEGAGDEAAPGAAGAASEPEPQREPRPAEAEAEALPAHASRAAAADAGELDVCAQQPADKLAQQAAPPAEPAAPAAARHAKARRTRGPGAGAAGVAATPPAFTPHTLGAGEGEAPAGDASPGATFPSSRPGSSASSPSPSSACAGGGAAPRPPAPTKLVAASESATSIDPDAPLSEHAGCGLLEVHRDSAGLDPVDAHSVSLSYEAATALAAAAAAAAASVHYAGQAAAARVAETADAADARSGLLQGPGAPPVLRVMVDAEQDAAFDPSHAEAAEQQAASGGRSDAEAAEQQASSAAAATAAAAQQTEPEEPEQQGQEEEETEQEQEQERRARGSSGGRRERGGAWWKRVFRRSDDAPGGRA